MTDTAKSIAQFKKMRDSEIEAGLQAGDSFATAKAWAVYATRLEMHCQAVASRLATAEARLKKIAEADETGPLDQDSLFAHTYDDIEYLTTSEDCADAEDGCVRVFVGGVEVTSIVDEGFMSVAQSAHYWAAEKAAREAA
jgi:hypothetical protein